MTRPDDASVKKEVLRQLQLRNSAPRLCGPAPDEQARQEMFRAALRAPDHAWLQPWRFVVVEDEGLRELGKVFELALLDSDPEAPLAARRKARQKALRAPLLVTVVCALTEHPKVPREEQLISTGCAAYAMLLAAEALGYAGIWRTGSFARNPRVSVALGLQDHEEIVGFLYLGSRDGAAKSLPEREPSQYVRHWDRPGS